MRCVRFVASLVLLAGLTGLAGCGEGTAGDLAVEPAAPGPSLDLPVPPTTPSCPASGARVTVGPVDGAMGLRAVTLELTNCGGAAYRVSGYPGVGVLDEEGDVPVEVVQGFDPASGITDAPPTTFSLAPGETARAGLVWRLLVQEGESVTGPLVVTPAPGEQRQRPGLDVDLGTTRKLTVGSWQPTP